MLLGAILLGVAEMVIGGSRSYPADLALMFLAGAGAITMMATANTTMQLAVPDGLRGRVMSVYTTVFAGSSPVGGLTMGALASNFSAATALFVGGLVSFVAGLAGILWYRALKASGGIPERVDSGRRRVPVVTSAGVGATAATGVPPLSR
jgi:MFS family permease